MPWSALSSRKLARMAALSFWITARSSAIVLAARTLRMNCFTITPELLICFRLQNAWGFEAASSYRSSSWEGGRPREWVAYLVRILAQRISSANKARDREMEILDLLTSTGPRSGVSAIKNSSAKLCATRCHGQCVRSAGVSTSNVGQQRGH